VEVAETKAKEAWGVRSAGAVCYRKSVAMWCVGLGAEVMGMADFAVATGSGQSVRPSRAAGLSGG
jgi:hypothetical protein